MNKVVIPIKLAVPIEKDGKELASIDIRKPCAGDLRGLNLVDVCQMDFEAHSTLLSRISILNERDLLDMDPANWAPLQTEIAGFFVDTKH